MFKGLGFEGLRVSRVRVSKGLSLKLQELRPEKRAQPANSSRKKIPDIIYLYMVWNGCQSLQAGLKNVIGWVLPLPAPDNHTSMWGH